MPKKTISNKLKTNKLKQSWSKFKDWRSRVRQRQRDGHVTENKDLSSCPECTCMNCGHTYQGHNCPNCGQAATTRRITMRTALHNMMVTLIGGDSVFLRTCGHLLYRPGYMIRDFLCGKRTRYFRPVQMLLCLLTLYALLTFFINDNSVLLNDMHNLKFDDANKEATFSQATQTLSNFLSNKVAFSLVFAFISVLPYKLLFRRYAIAWPDGEQRKMNTAEHFFTLIYLSCLNLLVGFILMPLQWIPGTESFLADFEIILPFVLFTWAYRQIYRIGWLNSLWRNIVANAMVLVIIVILLILYYGVYYGISAAIG